jgi:hypothetical protein
MDWRQDDAVFNLVSHVGASINALGREFSAWLSVWYSETIRGVRDDLRNRGLESLFDGLDNFFILLRADERNRYTLGSETTSSAHTMEV